MSGPPPSQQFKTGLKRPVNNLLQEAAEIGVFTGRALMELRGVWRYSAEILRQCGILIAGSAAIICFMTFLMGTTCGTEANYVLRGYGATVYSGVFTSYCAVREMIPYMWGYIVAAKVGCGLCAEIGSMRIQDEIDAMESMGLNPMRYIVATRLVAGWITFPLIWVLAVAAHWAGNFLVIVVQIGEVSQGGWENVHWTFTTPKDIVFCFIKVMITSTTIMILGMFYGYRASGGPVGVGNATAKSMILNLIMIHVLGAAMTMLFWGVKPNAPVGG
ncbi:Intermembrane phospholipid transport system permease protein MlaE [Paraconexibacter sp. AEG42_29]|uniref:Intermembrane phospholipid transport system permease protein MlaE n=1 Tax=Paraconexibacter sp. AEG42_29 TaxID=2997339 RepID=A0AAU7AQX2_9ACTN